VTIVEAKRAEVVVEAVVDQSILEATTDAIDPERLEVATIVAAEEAGQIVRVVQIAKLIAGLDSPEIEPVVTPAQGSIGTNSHGNDLTPIQCPIDILLITRDFLDIAVEIPQLTFDIFRTRLDGIAGIVSEFGEPAVSGPISVFATTHAVFGIVPISGTVVVRATAILTSSTFTATGQHISASIVTGAGPVVGVG
jgi:hypothetical protein